MNETDTAANSQTSTTALIEHVQDIMRRNQQEREHEAVVQDRIQFLNTQHQQPVFAPTNVTLAGLQNNAQNNSAASSQPLIGLTDELSQTIQSVVQQTLTEFLANHQTQVIIPTSTRINSPVTTTTATVTSATSQVVPQRANHAEQPQSTNSWPRNIQSYVQNAITQFFSGNRISEVAPHVEQSQPVPSSANADRQAHIYQNSQPLANPNAMINVPHSTQQQQMQYQAYRDPLFAKLEMPKITTKNAEYSLEKLESWLNINGIFEDTRRFEMLKMQLDPSVYAHVSHLLRNPPPFQRFNTLKNSVIKVLTDSEVKKAHDLISGLQLGDKKPSILLAEMRQLHNGPINDNLFRELWLSRLPQNVKSILMGNMSFTNGQYPPLEQLADTADRIMDYTNGSNTAIDAVTSTPPPDFYRELNNTLGRIGDQLKWLTDRHRIDTQNSARENRPSNKKKAHEHESNEPCVYHRRFGRGQHKNRKCEESCPLHKEWTDANADTKQKN